MNTAVFDSVDTTTLGSWVGAYGADGYVFAKTRLGPELETVYTSIPSYATFGSSTGVSVFQWAASGASSLGLQKPDNNADRFAATWYTGGTETFDLTISSGYRTVAIYFDDYDSGGRQATVTVLDGTDGTTVLDSRVVNYANTGVYAIYKVSGHLKFKIEGFAGPNYTVSGFFFDPHPQVSTNLIEAGLQSDGSDLAFSPPPIVLPASGETIYVAWNTAPDGVQYQDLYINGVYQRTIDVMSDGPYAVTFDSTPGTYLVTGKAGTALTQSDAVLVTVPSASRMLLKRRRSIAAS